MIWEWLLGIPVYPEAPAGILLALDFIPILSTVAFAVMTAYFAVKLSPWKEVVNSSGGTLGIIVDMGKRIHFVNMKNKSQYELLKHWGMLTVAPTGLYKAVKQNCTVGIWSTRICVPLPVHLAPVAQTRKDPSKPAEEALKEKYGSDDIAIAKLPVKDEKEKEQQQKELKKLGESYGDNVTMPFQLFKKGILRTATFYQFMVDEWNKWFMETLNPVLFKMEVHDLARGLAKLSYEESQRAKFNVKLLLFVVIGAAAALLMLMMFM